MTDFDWVVPLLRQEWREQEEEDFWCQVLFTEQHGFDMNRVVMMCRNWYQELAKQNNWPIVQLSDKQVTHLGRSVRRAARRELGLPLTGIDEWTYQPPPLKSYRFTGDSLPAARASPEVIDQVVGTILCDEEAMRHATALYWHNHQLGDNSGPRRREIIRSLWWDTYIDHRLYEVIGSEGDIDDMRTSLAIRLRIEGIIKQKGAQHGGGTIS